MTDLKELKKEAEAANRLHGIAKKLLRETQALVRKTEEAYDEALMFDDVARRDLPPDERTEVVA